tara:strand:- start:397 stop:2478 length:2082 start_codon:yes stop_codon:yes gene_type:complete
MANRRSGGYYNPYGYGGRGNPYSGKGIITRRSPFSEPFVDYGKHFSAGVAKWMPIHLAYFDQMEKNISEGRTKYAEDVAAFRERAETTNQPINEEQQSGGEVTTTEIDDDGNETTTTKTILGEDEDLKQFVEQYAEKYRIANNIRGKYYKRGKKKGQLKKYVGFGGGESITEEGIAARADLKRIERAVETAKADKINYNTIQNEFYNDSETQRIIGAQTKNHEYDRFMKFIDRDNLTRFDQQTGEMFIVAKDCKAPPCEISVTELAKLKPDLVNKEKISTLRTQLRTVLDPKTIGNFTRVNQVKTGEFKDGVEVMKDVREIDYGAIYDHLNLHTQGWNYDDFRNAIHNDTTMSFDGKAVQSPYSSNEFRVLDIIYKAQASMDSKDENSINYKLLKDREEEYGMPNGAHQKFTNDQNFIINKDLFNSESDINNKLLGELSDMVNAGVITGLEALEVANYVNVMGNYADGHHITALQENNQTISTIATDAYKRLQINTIKDALEGNIKSSQMPTHKQIMDRDESARKWRELDLKERQFEHKKIMDDIESEESDFTLIDHIDEVFSYKLGNNPEKIKNSDLAMHFTGLPIMSSDNKKVGEMNLLVAKPDLEFLKKGDVLTIEYNTFGDQTTIGKSKTIKQEKSELRKPSYIIFNGDLETLKSELNKRLYEASPAFTKSSFKDNVWGDLKKRGINPE